MSYADDILFADSSTQSERRWLIGRNSPEELYVLSPQKIKSFRDESVIDPVIEVAHNDNSNIVHYRWFKEMIVSSFVASVIMFVLAATFSQTFLIPALVTATAGLAAGLTAEKTKWLR